MWVCVNLGREPAHREGLFLNPLQLFSSNHLPRTGTKRQDVSFARNRETDLGRITTFTFIEEFDIYLESGDL
jgi:hypothetical protein